MKALTILTTSTAALALSALVAVSAQPQMGKDGDRPEPPRTLAEATEQAQASFEKMDTNDDGYLTKEDRSVRMKKGDGPYPDKAGKRGAKGDRPDMYEDLDSDDDGVLTRDEFTDGAVERFDERMAKRDPEAMRDKVEERAGAHFDRLDADDDGKVTKDEMDAARAKMMDRDHHRRGSHRMGPDGPHEPKFGGADADDDGKVSEAEFIAAATKRFEAVDTDGDGELSDAELEAAKAARKARWESRKKGRDGQ